MKKPFANSRSSISYRLLMFVVIICALLAVPLWSNARPQPSSITIVNNSNYEIRHVYLSPTSEDNWGADQLDDTSITPGASFTLGSVSCDGSEIKVITEDKDGCFLYKVVSCSSNATWTIASDATPDCGN